MAYGIESF